MYTFLSWLMARLFERFFNLPDCERQTFCRAYGLPEESRLFLQKRPHQGEQVVKSVDKVVINVCTQKQFVQYCGKLLLRSEPLKLTIAGTACKTLFCNLVLSSRYNEIKADKLVHFRICRTQLTGVY